MCDVCGDYIISDKSINPFSIKGIEGTLCCHDDCKPKVLRAFEMNDWRFLPEGPIRKAFQEAEGAKP